MFSQSQEISVLDSGEKVKNVRQNKQINLTAMLHLISGQP